MLVKCCRFEFMLLDIAAGHTLGILDIARLNHALKCDEFKLEYIRLFQITHSTIDALLLLKIASCGFHLSRFAS